METEPLNSTARAAMETLNAQAERSGLHIWLRTQANAPAQRTWFRDGGLEPGGELAKGRVGANQMKAAPYHWGWQEIGPYLDRIGEIAPRCRQTGGRVADRVRRPAAISAGQSRARRALAGRQ